ncbi:MAG TPA: asparagine synthase (glutamine-hydrolyzing) [Steroidobacteraceae bacterium]
MCGVCGFIDLRGDSNSPENRATLSAMIAQLRHRGPNDSGSWVDDARSGVSLGHTRLSILDLSYEGHQPMVSASGRYVIVFNGEIYNHKDIRKDLEASTADTKWRGHSDTEVILEAISHWGLLESLERFNGMFAFALWDRQNRALHLARDRLGEKPMYYGWMGEVLLFGSELKALRAHSSWHGEIDRDSLSLFMRHNYIPAPFSIYKGIRKLPPATLITFRQHDRQRWPEPEIYWSAKLVAERGFAHPLQAGDELAEQQLHQLLLNAVALRMEADVPLGAFLSGGVDSSTVVALMQALSSRPVNTFSIGFTESGYDEATHARCVAAHLKTSHTELYVTSSEAMAVIPRLPQLYDEPFADCSQIPTFLVSQLARQHVTVSLSGDGGDELFGGYNRYFWGARIWKTIGWMPPALRATIAAALNALRPATWDTMTRWTGRVFPHMMPRMLGDKLQKLAEALPVTSPELLYRSLVTHWENPDRLVLDAHEPVTVLTDPARCATVADFSHYMMYQDTVSYLPDDILVKVDRASMGVSLEARVPLLDHRVVELAWRVPNGMKFRGGQGKWLLRQVLHRYVPREMIERPKMGFGVPIDSWLRGPLREWAESLLEESRLRQEGFFAPDPIRGKWSEHLARTHNWQYQLWDVLMFQAWLENERSASP